MDIVKGVNMAFVNKSDISKVGNKAMTAGGVISAVAGGLGGFFAADVIGFSSLINNVWDTVGLESIIPALNNVQPMIVALAAAGIYMGLGYAILKIDGSGALGMVTKFIGWFGIGAGIREAFTGLTTGVAALKSAGKKA